MTNKILTYSQDPVITSMVQRLNAQVKAQALLEKKLMRANEKLAQVRRILAEKNHIIDSMQVDLEHVIDVAKSKQIDDLATQNNDSHNRPWMEKPLPGVTTA